MQPSRIVFVTCLLGLALLLVLPESSPPVVARSTRKVAHFDYGNVPVPVMRSTAPAFESTPASAQTLISGALVGALDVVQPTSGVSAFDDVKPESESVPTPVGATSTEESAFATTETEEYPAPPPPPSIKQTETATTVAKGTTFNIADHVYPIRANGGNVGGAVAISPDTLLTVYHVAKYNGVQVGIEGKWYNSDTRTLPQPDDGYRDGAILRLNNTRLPSLNVRAPVYYEPVTIYGFKTKKAQQGFVSSARTVSLAPSNEGIRSGDSGGLVLADNDHSVVGIITGNEAENKLIPAGPNTRVVYMARGDLFLPYITKQPVATIRQTSAVSTPPIPVESTTPQKPSESAWDSQPSAFDPPAVNTPAAANCSQPKMAANCSQPSYFQSQAPMYYYGSGPNCVNGVCSTVPMQNQNGYGVVIINPRRWFRRW